MSTLIPERMESLNVRTIEFVLGGMEEAQKAFAEHDLVANVSLETYNGDPYFRRELDCFSSMLERNVQTSMQGLNQSAVWCGGDCGLVRS